jgi:TRAP-type mannitol/chloroaromatic compound transport system permease small subunit
MRIEADNERPQKSWTPQRMVRHARRCRVRDRSGEHGAASNGSKVRTASGRNRILKAIAFLVRAISGLNLVVGNVFAWLSLGIVVVCFTVVLQRYVLHTTQLWMQDLYIWLNGAMFTGVAGFALLRNDHVRVDIFYRPASVERKAIIDLIGVVVFLLPFTWVVAAYGWNFVSRSWRLYEGSANIGGMPGLFILKSFILVFAGLIALQGIAMVGRSILVLTGNETLLPVWLRYESQQETH